MQYLSKRHIAILNLTINLLKSYLSTKLSMLKFARLIYLRYQICHFVTSQSLFSPLCQTMIKCKQLNNHHDFSNVHHSTKVHNHSASLQIYLGHKAIFSNLWLYCSLVWDAIFNFVCMSHPVLFPDQILRSLVLE